MATCPAGHQSATDDFCDVCGFRIDAGVFTQTGAAPVMTGHGSGRQAAPPGGGPAERQGASVESCPRCGAPRVGQFCEDCGYSFAMPQPVRPPRVGAVPAARTNAPRATAAHVPPAVLAGSRHRPASPRLPGSARRRHLVRGGDRRPRLLRVRAGHDRPGRRRDQLPRILPRTAVPALRIRGSRRTAQRVPRHQLERAIHVPKRCPDDTSR